MIAAEIIGQVVAAGGQIAADGTDLVLTADHPLPAGLLDRLKAHKPEILAALERHDDAEDLREAFEERAQNAKSEGVDLTSLLTEACQGVPGIDAATFRALLSPEDIEDIVGGYIPLVMLNAYAESFADGIRCGRITVLAAVIPKATLTSRVRCGGCRHFERDTIGDGSGIGCCKIGGEGTGPRYPALWANAQRECKDFEARYNDEQPR